MEVTVRTERPHGNRHGAKYQKAVGDEYPLPEAAAAKLKALGLVSYADQDLAELKRPQLAKIAKAAGVEVDKRDTADTLREKIIAKRASEAEVEA